MLEKKNQEVHFLPFLCLCFFFFQCILGMFPINVKCFSVLWSSPAKCIFSFTVGLPYNNRHAFVGDIYFWAIINKKNYLPNKSNCTGTHAVKTMIHLAMNHKLGDVIELRPVNRESRFCYTVELCYHDTRFSCHSAYHVSFSKSRFSVYDFNVNKLRILRH